MSPLLSHVEYILEEDFYDFCSLTIIFTDFNKLYILHCLILQLLDGSFMVYLHF